MLLKDRILTREVLERRGIWCELPCEVCNTGDTETAIHLFFMCPYAQEVWRLLFRQVHINPSLIRGETISEFWDSAWDQARGLGMINKKTWSTWIDCACWMIWKQRNGVLFRGVKIAPHRLAQQIMDEVRMWLANC